MIDLTPRQSEVLSAIKDYQARLGFPPTVKELAELIGVSSPNAAADHVNVLKKKGYITVAPGAARGITILEDTQESGAIPIIKSLLNGNEYAREHAIAWLEARGVKL